MQKHWTLLLGLTSRPVHEIETAIDSDAEPLALMLESVSWGAIDEVRSAGDPHCYLMHILEADIGLLALREEPSLVWMIAADDLSHAGETVEAVLRVGGEEVAPSVALPADDFEPLPLAAVSYARAIRDLCRAAPRGHSILIVGSATESRT